MRKHLLLVSIALLSISGFSQNVADSIYAVVNGNQVTIYQDDATRNCGFLPNLENAYLQDGNLKWYQVDVSGEVYGCECLFDYSVSIDSLNPGTYNVGVYYVYFSDTIFEGTTSFTIESQYPCDNVLELSSYAGTCQVAVKEIPTDNLVIMNTSDVLSISLHSTEKITRASLSNISGQKIYAKSYTSGNEIHIPTSSFKPGIYVISIITNSGQYNRKIILGR